jgi:DNA end-binding protein Ku
MYNATTSGNPVKFNLLHKKCNTRIRQQKVCPKCDENLSKDDIVKGYRYGKDMYIIMEDEDFEKAEKETTDFIDVFKFVPRDDIKPLYYYDSHYLVPDGKVGTEPFALFHEAITTGKKAGLAKMVRRNKEYLLSVTPFNGAFMAYTLHYSEEINNVKNLDELDMLEKVDVAKQNLDMAQTIIDNLGGEFNPEDYIDEYSETLKKIIQAKAEGEEVKVAPKVEKGKVINLMEALEKSLEETEKVPRKKMAQAGKSRKKGQKRKKA